jgi:hypothetical protein
VHLHTHNADVDTVPVCWVDTYLSGAGTRAIRIFGVFNTYVCVPRIHLYSIVLVYSRIQVVLYVYIAYIYMYVRLQR